MFDNDRERWIANGGSKNRNSAGAPCGIWMEQHPEPPAFFRCRIWTREQPYGGGKVAKAFDTLTHTHTHASSMEATGTALHIYKVQAGCIICSLFALHYSPQWHNFECGCEALSASSVGGPIGHHMSQRDNGKDNSCFFMTNVGLSSLNEAIFFLLYFYGKKMYKYVQIIYGGAAIFILKKFFKIILNGWKKITF